MSSAASDETASEALCPRGPESCPVFEEITFLKESHDRLSELWQSDPLTGLYNFRYLCTTLDQEMERTRRVGSPFSVIMVDLDHFKRINDEFGHPTGNHALKHAAACLRDGTRKLDTVCRYGGEEFVIVLPATRLLQATKVAERLRCSLAASELGVDGQSLRMTASFGVDSYRGTEDGGREALLARVDRWMLQAKRHGRNQVQASPDSSSAITSEERKDLSFDF